jgi:hypothetical protein
MDNHNSQEKPAKPALESQKDSLGFPISKNPWLIYALAHIPIVLIMVAILYVLYHSKQP